jgi:hypothetical protein
MRPHTSDTSLQILIDRLVAFLQEQQKQPKTSLSIPSPDGLGRVFDTFSHHLVALMLVARSDDKVVERERAAILEHCADRARKAGLEMTAAERNALHEYLRHFHPAEMLLGPAMAQLKRDRKDDIAALVAAAHRVVEADGVVRLQEASYLLSLQHDLIALA